MSKAMEISMFAVAEGPYCVASGDGEKVYARISKAFAEDRKVAVSFHNVEALTPAFLNAAIGQLYGSFSEERIRELLKITGLEQDDLLLLKDVVDDAKLYFKDPERYDRIVAEVQENGEDEAREDACPAAQLYIAG